MILARLALEREEDAFVEICRKALGELYPRLTFSPERTRGVFRCYIEEASPVIWVCEHNRVIVGFCMAEWGDHAFADGLLAEQRLIYVSPDHRGTRAAAKLLSAFNQWADQLGAVEKRFASFSDRQHRGRSDVISVF